MTYESCLHELVEQECEYMKDAPAIIDGADRISYAELNSAANRLARILRHHGVKPEVLVGVYIDRSIDFVIAVLAILKAGGAYVPLEPSLPFERLHQMMHESALSLIIVPQPLPFITECGIPFICLADVLHSQEDDANLGAIARPNNLAYVIFTSGSTGTPKGVMNSHRAICNRLIWGKTCYRLEKTDVILHQTPVSFDPSIWEIFGGLISGAKIVISRADGYKDLGYIARMIVEHHVTIVDFVPVLLRLFVQHADSKDCQSLRCITCAGETLAVDLPQMVFERFPQVRLLNLYGPTEASIDALYWECRRDDEERASIPIGHAIHQMYYVLLNEYGDPVPPGEIGEICLGGIGLGRGYIHRPDLTAERFIPDVTGATWGARLYRTGDRGRVLPNGELEYLGRMDRQVKIHGVRVELAEIESLLMRHPHISATAVTAYPDSQGNLKIAAYLVVKDETTTSEEIRDYVAEHLPRTMIPSTFMLLGALPLNHSGKINYQELPAPVASRPVLLNAYVPPQTEIQQAVGAIWQEVLGVSPIGIDDPFFELGGHSLALVQVHAQICAKLQWNLTLSDLFQYPTIRQLTEQHAAVTPSSAWQQRANARQLEWQRRAALRTSTTRRPQ